MTAREKLWNEKLGGITARFSKRIQRDLVLFPEPYSGPLRSTYIYGTVGSGKTLLGMKMLVEWMRQDFMSHIRRTYIWVTVPDLLQEIRSSYSAGSENFEEEVIGRYSKVDVLLLDDLGVEKTTDWAYQILYVILNRRYEALLDTIITGNFSPGELSLKLGDGRIPSRICQMCCIVETPSIDYRLQG
jgi:DNA replication protein DnaC